MSDKTIIRFAEKKDINDLVELCRLHAEYEQSEYSTEDKERLLSEQLFSELAPLHCIIAELNNEMVGYASYMKQFSTWDANFYIYMDCLFLKESSRGHGIGADLVDRIKIEARKMGCNLIQWQTPDFNIRAMKFYKRIGAFSKTKERFFLEL